MEEFDEEFSGDVEEVRAAFAGDWRITKLHGYTDAELQEGEPPRITFWEDGTGELVCGGMDVNVDVRYGETMEGLAAVTFKGRRSSGEKRASVSGLGAIQRGGKALQGSVTIGGRARGFTATKLP